MPHKIEFISKPLSIECTKQTRAKKKTSYKQALLHAKTPRKTDLHPFETITLQLTLNNEEITTKTMSELLTAAYLKETCQTLVANPNFQKHQLHLVLNKPNQKNNLAAYNELTGLINHIRKHITLDAKDSDRLNTLMQDVFSQKNSKKNQDVNTSFQGGNLAR